MRTCSVHSPAEHGFPIPDEAELLATPGTQEALAALDVPVCVASSGIPKRLRTSLKIVGLLERFDPYVFSATMVARGKPAPDLFLQAARSMGANPGLCLVVEDSMAGVRAAVAAGMTAIGFCGGKHCRPDHADLLRQHGAVDTILDMRDLLPLIA